MPVSDGLSLSRRFRALPRSAIPLASWRNLIGKFWSGFLFHPQARSESPQRRFCSELTAQELTLRPRAPGLPHHRRHPLTADEALAGTILGLLCLSGLVYLIARLF
jgi:hypothetical protein